VFNVTDFVLICVHRRGAAGADADWRRRYPGLAAFCIVFHSFALRSQYDLTA
jgi:hypothetical protein